MALTSNLHTAITQPGQLDRSVILQSATFAQDNLGQSIATWSTAATVYGAWYPVTGREQVAAAELQALQTGTLRIRWRSDILSTWRVVMNSVTFEIIAPPVEVGRHLFLDLALRAISTAVV